MQETKAAVITSRVTPVVIGDRTVLVGDLEFRSAGTSGQTFAMEGAREWAGELRVAGPTPDTGLDFRRLENRRRDGTYRRGRR